MFPVFVTKIFAELSTRKDDVEKISDHCGTVHYRYSACGIEYPAMDIA
jgi:hypothetical protein